MTTHKEVVIEITMDEVRAAFEESKRLLVTLAAEKAGMKYPVYGEVHGVDILIGQVEVHLREEGLRLVEQDPNEMSWHDVLATKDEK